MAWHDLGCLGNLWHGMAWHGVVWQLVAWHGMATESESGPFRRWLRLISKLGLATNFLASVASQVPLPSAAPSSHIILQPASTAAVGGSESESEEKAAGRDRLACLLMPALLASRLLSVNITVLFSDPSSIWLHSPLPHLPPSFSVLLPSTAHPSTPPSFNTTTPTPLDRSLIGSLTPWLLLLRPSPPSSSPSPSSLSCTHSLTLSWGLHAFKALSRVPSVTTNVEGEGEGVRLALTVAVQSALNHAVARVVEAGPGEAGGEGMTVGVLPEGLFPPSTLVCEDRHWLQQHREEVVAFRYNCRAGTKHRVPPSY
ncbi:hypothetical protein CLOM_g12364 [Closterium sp. NIES-68]|nr:hypothetical protein CLOM_g12364 [Closterium sp. NIES-68]GJP80614.1 hypothetical protein CLOP_g10816 [Closterium sp. NIES-67]